MAIVIRYQQKRPPRGKANASWSSEGHLAEKRPFADIDFCRQRAVPSQRR